jgi:hypothetical protein
MNNEFNHNIHLFDPNNVTYVGELFFDRRDGEKLGLPYENNGDRWLKGPVCENLGCSAILCFRWSEGSMFPEEIGYIVNLSRLMDERTDNDLR